MYEGLSTDMFNSTQNTQLISYCCMFKDSPEVYAFCQFIPRKELICPLIERNFYSNVCQKARVSNMISQWGKQTSK